MNEESQRAYRKLQEAFARLSEGVRLSKDDLDRDGVIQRFEFTFELLWKSLKIFLRTEGIEAITPRETVKWAFKLGLINNEEGYLDMLDDRNLTSHVYDQRTAEEIFERIAGEYLSCVKDLLDRLGKKLNGRGDEPKSHPKRK